MDGLNEWFAKMNVLNGENGQNLSSVPDFQINFLRFHLMMRKKIFLGRANRDEIVAIVNQA